MCARHQDLRQAIEQAVAAEAALARPACDEAASARRRIALWEQGDSVHCSIVGTCASVADLRRVARKTGIEVAPDTPDYDVHGHFVRLSTTDCAFSRAFQKLLDSRFEGALRRVGRTREADALDALWNEMCERGQVAAAYWAFMTHAHVPGALRARIFGEVHMWSHLAGASFRRKNEEAAALRDQLAEAEDRARRVENGLREALAARDRELAGLREQVARLRADRPQAAAAEAGPAGEAGALRRRLDKTARALQSARARARMAEARLRQIETGRERSLPARTGAVPAPVAQVSGIQAQPSPARAAAGPGERPRAILYVGGMHGHRDRLRGIAEAFNATFLHHDGGVEDAPQRLDHLLPSVDCVFCPVNCVSHDACLRAKKICQKLNKPFVPLRSTGQTAFRKALQDLVTAGPAIQIAGDDANPGETA